MTTRADRLANALGAMGCSHPRSHAVLMLEVWHELEEDDLTVDQADNVRSLGQKLTEERGARYAHPKDNWRRIGIKWQATLDLPEPIPPHLVGIMMMDVKTSRLVSTPSDDDSLDDLEGYAEAQRMLFR